MGLSLFISYSHDSPEHRDIVLGLSERLRRDGLETRLDRYVNGMPAEGWPRWMLDQLDSAAFVLVVCTPTYYKRFRGHEVPGKGRGVDWEGALITQELYEARNHSLKFVPVLLDPGHADSIPEPLRKGNSYCLTTDDSYQSLFDFLVGRAGVEPGPIGAIQQKPRNTGMPLAFDKIAAVTEASSQSAQQGIRALVELKSSPEIRTAVDGIERAFVHARNEIEELNRCKKMHEFLHQTQADYDRFKKDKEKLEKLQSRLELQEDEDDFRTECDEAWEDLDAFVNDKLSTCVGNLLVYARSDAFPRDQVLWASTMERAQDDLVKTCACRDTKLMNRASERIWQVLGEQPSRFDNQLFQAAQRLRLGTVVAELSKIRDQASRVHVSDHAAACLRVFRQGIDGLSDLDKRLQGLVSCHNHLQHIDGALRTVQFPCKNADDIEKIVWIWPDLVETMNNIQERCEAEWVSKFRATRAELDGELSRWRDEGELPQIREISRRFGRFCSVVNVGFTQTDLNLLSLCGKLENISDELGDAIRSMQHD